MGDHTPWSRYRSQVRLMRAADHAASAGDRTAIRRFRNTWRSSNGDPGAASRNGRRGRGAMSSTVKSAIDVVVPGDVAKPVDVGLEFDDDQIQISEPIATGSI